LSDDDLGRVAGGPPIDWLNPPAAAVIREVDLTGNS
jgi:hypothetical protein